MRQPNLSAIAQFITIKFQKGSVQENGVNGCRIEDVIDVLSSKLGEYQSGPVACLENAEALHHLELARKALLRRRQLREQQGVLDTMKSHESLFDHRTEDIDSEFSATGS